ncbi:Putative Lunapark domain-containing protein [Septoria linicola]|uniref:Endoplasmic reticulum junction formation protein lunapark n=1 Tax=Septoria linicola TaxID=215465 RepID=A0A9Q9B0C0_9PEZI|nr:putative Lunapark domain-containing protein [Septoria linicola]USW55288.1 Putative Lunapark domain-containing protein [Septoria linicola]
MVSFWPFKGGANDAASFEKELSQLSTKINKATAHNAQFQQRRRRYKVLWTLYTSFTYILIAAILTLVTGWEKWGAVEYSAMAGSPLLIYAVRTGLDAYYNYRISHSQNYLNDLQAQREKAIKRLKAATKYDSTQQLLEKYGGSPPAKKESAPAAKEKRHSGISAGDRTNTPQARTGFAPPPTANIPSRRPPPPGPPPPGMPVTSGTASQGPNSETAIPAPRDNSGPSEEFAPNAFEASNFSRPPTLRQPSQYAVEGPKWYDRIMDVVLGEDETQAKNRIALICQSCRLVNGQAPPGARTLEDIGKWRCSACHTLNGVESEEKKILKQITGEPSSPGTASQAVPDEAGEESAENAEAEDEEEDDIDDASPAASTRSKARQRKKA